MNLAAAFIIAAVISLAGCSSFAYRGSVVDPPVSLPELRLTDTQGKDFSLSSQRGSVVLLYFGYTHCPDACPETLSHLAQARRVLAQAASNLSIVFVTTDPERDTAEVLKQYVGHFDPAIIALRGTPEELAAIYQGYHVAVIKEEPSPGQAGYQVGHSDLIYVIDKSGRWRESFDSTSSADDLVNDIRHLIQE